MQFTQLSIASISICGSPSDSQGVWCTVLASTHDLLPLIDPPLPITDKLDRRAVQGGANRRGYGAGHFSVTTKGRQGAVSGPQRIQRQTTRFGGGVSRTGIAGQTRPPGIGSKQGGRALCFSFHFILPLYSFLALVSEHGEKGGHLSNGSPAPLNNMRGTHGMGGFVYLDSCLWIALDTIDTLLEVQSGSGASKTAAGRGRRRSQRQLTRSILS